MNFETTTPETAQQVALEPFNSSNIEDETVRSVGYYTQGWARRACCFRRYVYAVCSAPGAESKSDNVKIQDALTAFRRDLRTGIESRIIKLHDNKNAPQSMCFFCVCDGW